MRVLLVVRGVTLLLAGLSVGYSARSSLRTTTSGLGVRVLIAGNGPVARPGQRVTIHETTIPTGLVVYTSRGGEPITFLLGGNQVTTGVDEGVTGMRVGERRVVVVPPALSRRATYPPNTPSDATLHVDVELL